MSIIEELKIKELNERKAPIVVIDKSLDKYDNFVAFPEKLAKINDILKKTGHPKDYLKEK